MLQFLSMAPADDSDEEEERKSDAEEEAPEAGAVAAVAEEAEEEEPPLVDAEGWMNMMDGKIRKRTLKEGKGGCPEMKQDVRCSVEIRLEDPSEESGEGELLMRWPEMRYRIGEGEAVPVLELCLRHMKEGEEAELFGASNMAWGPAGLRAAGESEQAIPPDADVRLRVTLVELLGISGSSQPSWNDLIQEVTWRKTNGNDYYKRQEYHKSLRSYAAGIQLFTDTGMEPPEYIEEGDRERVRAMALNIVADCGANLAAAHLELGNAVAAKASAEAALEIRPEHMKCLYRLAKASLTLDDFDGCEDALNKGFALDAENAALMQVQADLKHKNMVYQARSKKMAGKVFGGLEYPDLMAEKIAEKERRKKEEEEEDRWINWLKQAFFSWFDAKVAALLAVAAVLLMVALLLMPKRHWPIILMMFVMCVPAGIGLYIGSQEEDAKEKRTGHHKKKTS